MISLDRLVCRAYWGASQLERTLGEIHRSQPACRRHQRPRRSMRIIGMLWTGRSCRRPQCWLWRKRKRATGPASAPKLRQNRIKCSNLRFKYNDYCIPKSGAPRSIFEIADNRRTQPQAGVAHFDRQSSTNRSPESAGPIRRSEKTTWPYGRNRPRVAHRLMCSKPTDKRWSRCWLAVLLVMGD